MIGRLGDEVPGDGESFHDVATLAGVRIEHITSSATPDTASQLQGWDEWVLLLTGAAELEIAQRRLTLAPRDWVLIPAGTPHRVLTTAAGTEWLAVHGPPGPGALPPPSARS